MRGRMWNPPKKTAEKEVVEKKVGKEIVRKNKATNRHYGQGEHNA